MNTELGDWEKRYLMLRAVIIGHHNDTVKLTIENELIELDARKQIIEILDMYDECLSETIQELEEEMTGDHDTIQHNVDKIIAATKYLVKKRQDMEDEFQEKNM